MHVFKSGKKFDFHIWQILDRIRAKVSEEIPIALTLNMIDR